MIFSNRMFEAKIKLMMASSLLIFILLINSCGGGQPPYFVSDYKFQVTKIEVAPHVSLCKYWITCFDNTGMGNVTIMVDDSIGKWKIGEFLKLINNQK